MANKLPSYLWCGRHGLWFFRAVIPKSLRDYFPNHKREFRRSLRTDSRLEAVRRARILRVEVDRLFQRLEEDAQVGKKKAPDSSQARIDLITILNFDAAKGTIGELRIDRGDPEKERETANQILNLARQGGGQPPQELGDPLNYVVEQFCAEQKQWSKKTAQERRSALNLFERIVGANMPFNRIDHKIMRDFKQKLQKLPPYLNNKKEFKNKSIDEIIALGTKPIDEDTVNKKLDAVSLLFDWAVNHGYIDKNYAKGLGVKTSEQASERRSPFTNEELKRLFESQEYRDGFPLSKAYKYWVPLIGLYSGARLNEICQLHLADIRQEKEVWVFDINENSEDKKLKSQASKRLTPIHSTLIELGLLSYVNKLQAAGEKRLFPELTPSRDGYGKNPSRWFGKYRREKGLTDERDKDFHSLRHTFIDSLKQQGVPENEVKAIVGHTDKSITYGTYGGAYTPAYLSKIIERIDYHLTHLPCPFL